MTVRAIVVGLGFAGSVLSRELAEAGFEVLALERRSQIAGNMYETVRANGVRVHQYGPHIFHANSGEVFDYLSQYSDFYPYTHRVLGRIQGKLVPIPFNFTSIDALFPKSEADDLEIRLTEAYPDRERVFVSELMNHKDPAIERLGKFIFENVFVNYTAKQWGIPASEVDVSVINRVPVVLSKDDRYFTDRIQQMPLNGYTPLFEKLLDHPGITLRLNTNAAERLSIDAASSRVYFDGEPFDGPVLWTGAIDELFRYSLGPLPYRSLNMVFEDLPIERYQKAAVVNYPNEEEFTRITEFKLMTRQVLPEDTTILKEYPLPYDPEKRMEAYYPIFSAENQTLYDEYRALGAMIPNLRFCGRLAEYRYYNMDAVVERALQVAKEVIRKYAKC